jgi:hypothetical protein
VEVTVVEVAAAEYQSWREAAVDVGHRMGD